MQIILLVRRMGGGSFQWLNRSFNEKPIYSLVCIGCSSPSESDQTITLYLLRTFYNLGPIYKTLGIAQVGSAHSFLAAVEETCSLQNEGAKSQRRPRWAQGDRVGLGSRHLIERMMRIRNANQRHQGPLLMFVPMKNNHR
ncbi:uncharacterized protein LOC121396873 isoform X2 [Xenopus laevis]|uniref:Uncharacterized protein LOC121396873 isoform X2 n=1 Tax=Xenopus laevis TaxID=8355 RepID=A0A8J1LH68_XENLA|nr:uncharacterized protein LOC121396873 isoform X2 [Xenopus laevis]